MRESRPRARNASGRVDARDVTAQHPRDEGADALLEGGDPLVTGGHAEQVIAQVGAGAPRSFAGVRDLGEEGPARPPRVDACWKRCQSKLAATASVGDSARIRDKSAIAWRALQAGRPRSREPRAALLVGGGEPDLGPGTPVDAGAREPRRPRRNAASASRNALAAA